MAYTLIAHRGEPDNYPENSLAGYEAALRAGAGYIETDVQVCADGTPILSHDPTLLKITGHDLVITDTDYPVIQGLPASHAAHFGERFNGLRITRLDQFAALLKQWPEARAFVEAKHASVKVYGAARVIDIMLATLQEVLAQCIFISFEHEALVYTRKVSTLPIGWVLPEWSPNSRALAAELQPEYLFCNRKRLPPDAQPLWPGPWQWAVYTVNDADEVLAFGKRGIDMLETNAISKLLADPRLNETGGD